MQKVFNTFTMLNRIFKAPYPESEKKPITIFMQYYIAICPY